MKENKYFNVFVLGCKHRANLTVFGNLVEVFFFVRVLKNITRDSSGILKENEDVKECIIVGPLFIHLAFVSPIVIQFMQIL